MKGKTMKINFFDVNSKARMVNYFWVKDSSAKNNLRLKQKADDYEIQRKHYGWITVSSIKDVGFYASMDRPGIKEVLRLVLDGKVDGVYVNAEEEISLYMFEILTFYKILLENNVELIHRDDGIDFDDECSFTLECKAFLMQYSRRREE
jgi:predicted site-specific integrase-resolvase